MARIITSTHRYKPPPKRKGRKLAEITGPAVVTQKNGRRLAHEAAAEVDIQPPRLRLMRREAAAQSTTAGHTAGRDRIVTSPANDDRKSAVVTVRDRKLERWERMTHGDRSEGGGDPQALDRWRKFMAGALPPKQL